MSWLSDRLGIHLGNIGAPVGAAIGSFIPGVGTAIGAGLGQAVGALGSGHNVGQAAEQGLVAGGATKLGETALQIAGQGDSPSSGSPSPGTPSPQSGTPAPPGGLNVDPVTGDTVQPGYNPSPPGQSAIPDWAKNVGGFLGKNSGTLLQGAGVLEAAMQQKKANDLANSALKSEQDLFNQRAPLRAMGIQGMMNAGQGNPFAMKNPNAPPITPGMPPTSQLPPLPLAQPGAGAPGVQPALHISG